MLNNALSAMLTVVNNELKSLNSSGAHSFPQLGYSVVGIVYF